MSLTQANQLIQSKFKRTKYFLALFLPSALLLLALAYSIKADIYTIKIGLLVIGAYLFLKISLLASQVDTLTILNKNRSKENAQALPFKYTYKPVNKL